MPLQAMQFQPDNLGQMLLEGLKTGQGLVTGGLAAQQQYLANAINQRYGMPQAGANLKKTQLENQYYGPKTEAEMHLQNAQAGLYGKQAQEIAWKLNHPYMLGTNEMQTALAFAEPGQGGTATQPIPGQGGTGAYGKDNWVPNIPGQQSYSGWRPPQQPQDPQTAALQSIMQQRNGSLQIPAGSMDVLKQYPDVLQQAMQQTQQPQGQQPGQHPAQGQGFAGMSQKDIANMYLDKIRNEMEYKKTLMQSIQHRLSASGYKDLPPTEKAMAVAQLKGMGYTGDEAVKYLEDGHTIKQAAEEKGLDPNNQSSWPQPDAAPTTAVLTRVERANVANAALDAVQPEVTKAMAPYARRFGNGISAGLVKDIVSGGNVNQQAKALAAYAIGPEISALRINAQGANVGITAIRDITNKAQINFKTLGLSPGSEVFIKTQEQIGKWINQMNAAENKAAYKMPSYKASQQQDEFSNMSDDELEKVAIGAA